MFIFPANRQRFVHLQILASLHATPAQNALAGIVAIEGVGVVDGIRFRLERNLLMFDAQQLGGVVDSAVAVVVVANRAVDRKSTRLNSSHLGISYAVFC